MGRYSLHPEAAMTPIDSPDKHHRDLRCASTSAYGLRKIGIRTEGYESKQQT